MRDRPRGEKIWYAIAFDQPERKRTTNERSPSRKVIGCAIALDQPESKRTKRSPFQWTLNSEQYTTDNWWLMTDNWWLRKCQVSKTQKAHEFVKPLTELIVDIYTRLGLPSNKTSSPLSSTFPPRTFPCKPSVSSRHSFWLATTGFLSVGCFELRLFILVPTFGCTHFTLNLHLNWLVHLG